MPRIWRHVGLGISPSSPRRRFRFKCCVLTRERERQIRAWLIRHLNDRDPPQAAICYIAELLDAIVEYRLAHLKNATPSAPTTAPSVNQ